MPRKGGLYKTKGGGQPKLAKTTKDIKRDKNNRIVNPDSASLAAGRDAAMRANDSKVSKPEAVATTSTGK